MTARAKCLTQSISDLPADRDAFGPHQCLANTIADMIRSGEEGKSISLEGGWGSGKSTVGNLLKKALEVDSDISVWFFDAWAHEGDPLRRTFLERLIGHLQQREWVNRDKWNQRREELARRRKVTTTRNIPRFTSLGTTVGLLLLLFPILIPIGGSLFSAGLGDGSLLKGIIGIVLMLTPIIGIGIVIALHRLGVLRNAGNASSADDDIIGALFSNRAVTDTQTETIENPDPTSVEFGQTFTELMNDSFENPNRTLVAILDNLDRVAPDYALAIWSTLQTFLQHSEHDKPVWIRRLWLLIPYDARCPRHSHSPV